MSIKKHLLFFGELPPDSLHGIAISNKININLLKSSFSVDVIKESTSLSEHSKNSPIKFAKRLKEIFKVFSKSIFTRYDYFYLIYSLSVFGGLKTLAAIACFRISGRGKVVLHIHRGDFFKRYFNRFINRWISRTIFRLSHKLIVLSDTQKEEFKTLFNKPVYVLGNTVEYEYNKSERIRGNKKFIYISNYLFEKGIIDLLFVFSKLSKIYPEIYLKTFGEFSDPELKDEILGYNSHNICINGIISGINKYRELEESDCLILPSLNEGQPMILLEAMSVGTPVIASQTGLIPEILGVDYPFISIPGDRLSLESKILHFMHHKGISVLSTLLYTRYSELFSQKKHVEMLSNIFE
jgi:glycosyltransferase involved in cell wall biosynthesis